MYNYMIVSSKPLVVVGIEKKTKIVFAQIKKHHRTRSIKTSLLVLSILAFLLTQSYCQILQDLELQYHYLLRQLYIFYLRSQSQHPFPLFVHVFS